MGYIAPLDMLEGRQGAIQAEREAKLFQAREQRREKPQLNRERAVAQSDGYRATRRQFLLESNL